MKLAVPVAADILLQAYKRQHHNGVPSVQPCTKAPEQLAGETACKARVGDLYPALHKTLTETQLVCPSQSPGSCGIQT